MATNKNNNAQFMALLIDEYRALPSLWKADSEGYKNKRIKSKSYNHLLTAMKAVDPLLTMIELKKKIAGLRKCYRRELKKISKSIKSGKKGSKVHVPSLWYFDELHFLRNHIVTDLDDVQTDAADHFAGDDANNDEEEVKQKPPVPSFKIKPRCLRRFKRPSFAKKNTFPTKPAVPCPDIIQPQNQIKKDESTIFSESWAILFRKLSPDQKLFAKRCIDEALYQGQFGNLNSQTYRNMELNESRNLTTTPHQEQSVNKDMSPAPGEFTVTYKIDSSLPEL